MNSSRRIDDLIRQGKWIKNDIGMSRVQCFKLLKDEEKLMMIIISEELKIPIFTRVEKIMVVDNEIVLFYDGQYYERVEKDEYNRYKTYLSSEEWNIILEHNAIEKLGEKNMISEDKGFYAELHETIESYIERDYDKESTKELNYTYNL